MIPSWQRMSVEEFATCQQTLGAKIVRVDGIYWLQVRPLFFRPLLPFYEYPHGTFRAPRMAVFGGFQHAVPAGQIANSLLNLRMFENQHGYSLASLDYNRRRQVKLASQKFAIRPITDVNEFKQQAFPVYLSFYERTQYQYQTERRNRDGFSRWADTLFRIPKLFVLGGYREGVLEGVNVSLLVEETLLYLTSFCNSTSLPLFLADLMLHSLREAAGSQGIERIFAGMYTGERGLDEFYILRGCRLVRKPSVFHINTFAGIILRRWLPTQYAKLSGRLEDDGESREQFK